jgi:2-polyprenyl-6-methoxyphenol hydroxylase-like FAD-dependent oxidoreductase
VLVTLPDEAEIVVVGGGPAGLTAAIGLVSAGHDVIVIDAEEAREHTSRAAVIHAGTVRALRHLELADAVIETGLSIDKMSVRDRDLVLGSLDFGRLAPPDRGLVMIPQWQTEQLLGRRLAELGGVVHQRQLLRSLRRTGSAYLLRITDDAERAASGQPTAFRRQRAARS